MEEKVILVNTLDEVIGSMSKLEVHEKGVLHRAFSVFLFNTKNELLIQQRALEKYHSAGLWSNTCCSHPRLNEETKQAANRRLQEEMGIESNIHFLDSFIYHEEMENGLIEHEFDHIFIGRYNQIPNINEAEVLHWKYISIPDLLDEMNTYPEQFTIWFKISLPTVLEKLTSTHFHFN
jgi:isopentenyl-diphosphate Delta-isomerase